MSQHAREILIFGGVALYFVSAFLLLWLNPYHDASDEGFCTCPFCRSEERA